MKRNDKNVFEDDGHTIADMSGVDSHASVSAILGIHRKRHQNNESKDVHQSLLKNDISKQERKAYVFSAMLSGLLIALIYIGVFGLAIFLFLKFCM